LPRRVPKWIVARIEHSGGRGGDFDTSSFLGVAPASY
jgi:hypothetical protein